MASPNAETVFLRIPARRSYAPILQVGAAALARRLGMSQADVNDLRTVMDKAVVMLHDGLKEHESPRGAQGRTYEKRDLHVDVIFRIVDNRFEFEASRNATASVSDAAVRLFDDSVRELVDELRINPDTGAIWLGKALVAVR